MMDAFKYKQWVHHYTKKKNKKNQTLLPTYANMTPDPHFLSHRTHDSPSLRHVLACGIVEEEEVEEKRKKGREADHSGSGGGGSSTAAVGRCSFDGRRRQETTRLNVVVLKGATLPVRLQTEQWEGAGARRC